ncbi:SUMF1/EgtB/PvdO family nonheme iron enzyme [Pelagerythrobacter sp.]|uniref:SUMF1/EgtB/PvdO family nonheme iron enzyme n=1 Tax=Pelagerythrobacter sp. TaxID=2800702 RepID=UPI0035B47F81
MRILFALLLCVIPMPSGLADAQEVEAPEPNIACADCPTFISVPNPPPAMRRISHVAAFELTWNEYLAAYDAGACPIPRSDHGFSERRELDAHIDLFRIDWPATLLGPEEVECYADWLSDKIGRTVAIPTTQEWLWFARSGRATGRFPWGDNPDAGSAAIGGLSAIQDGTRDHEVRVPYLTWSQARHVNRYLSAVKVGQYPPTEWGLFDVFGNAWELTSDVSNRTAPENAPQPNMFAGAKRVRIVGQSHGLVEWRQADMAGNPNYAMIFDGRYSTGVAVRFILIE